MFAPASVLQSNDDDATAACALRGVVQPPGHHAPNRTSEKEGGGKAFVLAQCGAVRSASCWLSAAP